MLARHPAVRENIVMVHKDANDVAYLIAYVIPRQEISSDALRAYMQEQLPGYMIPASFLLLGSFPMTPNGKIDRKALSALYQRSVSSTRAYVGPRDGIELRLVQIWERALPTAPISIQDNFFELGGHSLLAIQLVAQMQQQFSTAISLSDLIQQGTIEHIARLIRTGSESDVQSPLVTLQAGEEKQPFFCVHPAGGSVLCYVDLARLLERPFYGLQAESLYAPESTDTSLEEMAARYISALQSVQPQGPYLLGGWSLGGVVAFEMARQLTAQGQKIAQLVLIDSSIPTLTTETPTLTPLELLTGFALQLGVSQTVLATTATTIEQAARNEQWAILFALLKDNNIVPVDSNEQQLQRLFHAYQITIHAWLHYQPQPYQGSLTLIKAEDRKGWEDNSDATLGWQGLVSKEVGVLTTPGDHYTLMRQPDVRSLAERVRQCLEATIPAETQISRI